MAQIYEQTNLNEMSEQSGLSQNKSNLFQAVYNLLAMASFVIFIWLAQCNLLG